MSHAAAPTRSRHTARARERRARARRRPRRRSGRRARGASARRRRPPATFRRASATPRFSASKRRASSGLTAYALPTRLHQGQTGRAEPPVRDRLVQTTPPPPRTPRRAPTCVRQPRTRRPRDLRRKSPRSPSRRMRRWRRRCRASLPAPGRRLAAAATGSAANAGARGHQHDFVPVVAELLGEARTASGNTPARRCASSAPRASAAVDARAARAPANAPIDENVRLASARAFWSARFRRPSVPSPNTVCARKVTSAASGRHSARAGATPARARRRFAENGGRGEARRLALLGFPRSRRARARRRRHRVARPRRRPRRGRRRPPCTWSPPCPGPRRV